MKHIVSPTPGSHLQPLAATRVVASGRQWPPSFSFHRQPLAPPCGQSSGRQSSGRQSSGRKWPPVATRIWFFIGSHLQPLAATRVAASGRQRAPAFSFHRQPLAATCSQSSGRKWPPEQVAASGRKWPQVAAFAKIKFVPFCTLSAITVETFFLPFLLGI